MILKRMEVVGDELAEKKTTIKAGISSLSEKTIDTEVNLVETDTRTDSVPAVEVATRAITALIEIMIPAAN
ncbi:hypothetical protein CCR75_000393 [Bremia lactucae]|uniref:Uncharacterized protein n=1 Tax=Bremia lactucae TaxID=4779 RepID=A0A976FPI7_BRELC|nr:hypothetical protein CCR75_000393 [Bremia lactucae]